MFESIWRHLTEVLLANVDDATVTKRDQQLAEHDAFRARHVSVYEGGQQYLEFLNSMLEEGRCRHIDCEVTDQHLEVNGQILGW